jgi:hypothetical protein
VGGHLTVDSGAGRHRVSSEPRLSVLRSPDRETAGGYTALQSTLRDPEIALANHACGRTFAGLCPFANSHPGIFPRGPSLASLADDVVILVILLFAAAAWPSQLAKPASLRQDYIGTFLTLEQILALAMGLGIVETKLHQLVKEHQRSSA